MHTSRKELYNLYSKIAYGYVLKNYSKSFFDRIKGKINVIYVTEQKGTVELHCKYTGNEFRLNIDLNKRSIEHRGCYSLNKGYSNKDLIEYNLKNINS